MFGDFVKATPTNTSMIIEYIEELAKPRYVIIYLCTMGTLAGCQTVYEDSGWSERFVARITAVIIYNSLVL
jgi:hypothetical protein